MNNRAFLFEIVSALVIFAIGMILHMINSNGFPMLIVASVIIFVSITTKFTLAKEATTSAIQQANT